MRSPAVTTKGPEGEPYPDFQARVKADAQRVQEKCAALDQFIPRCTACGETCDPGEAGTRCEENNMSMVSRWAQEKANVEWYRLGNFGGSWHYSEVALAVLLDLTRADAIKAAVDADRQRSADWFAAFQGDDDMQAVTCLEGILSGADAPGAGKP